MGSPFVARLAGSETVSELVHPIFITEPKHAQKSQSYSHMNLIFNWSHCSTLGLIGREMTQRPNYSAKAIYPQQGICIL